MEIFLMQHGIARPEGEDPEKSLTKEGTHDVSRMGTWAVSKGIRIDEIWHSGKKRAEQTATIVADIMEQAPKITLMEGLGPKDDVHPIANMLEASTQNILVVGHLPFLGRLIGLLTVKDPGLSPIEFRNAGMVCLDLGETGWIVKWAMIPDLLEQ